MLSGEAISTKKIRLVDRPTGDATAADHAYLSGNPCVCREWHDKDFTLDAVIQPRAWEFQLLKTFLDNLSPISEATSPFLLLSRGLAMLFGEVIHGTVEAV